MGSGIHDLGFYLLSLENGDQYEFVQSQTLWKREG